jgi:hypothetical protein
MSGDIIEVLPVALSLVRVPRSRVNSLYHPILKQILQPEPTFLAVTCNELELSIFAADSVLEDFESVTRKDARKLAKCAAGRRKGKAQTFEPVEVSSDKWKVIQIPSPGLFSASFRPHPVSPGEADSSGARVHELTAPIAAAGISILYQSSHQSDFIFVRDLRCFT